MLLRRTFGFVSGVLLAIGLVAVLISILFLPWIYTEAGENGNGRLVDWFSGAIMSGTSTLVALLGIAGLTGNGRSRSRGLVLLLGAGLIGGLVAYLLSEAKELDRTITPAPGIAIGGVVAIALAGLLLLARPRDPGPPPATNGRPTVTPSGWYTDPFSERRLRYWSGTGWTTHRCPRTEDESPGELALRTNDADDPVVDVTPSATSDS